MTQLPARFAILALASVASTFAQSSFAQDSVAAFYKGKSITLIVGSPPGRGYEATDFYGLGAPKDTPADVVGKLNGEVNAWLADAKIKARLADLGGSPAPGTPAEFGRQIVAETEKWAQVVKFSGAKAD